jgi:hypothetical protein
MIDTPTVTDPESLRDQDVPFHEETDTVDAETVDTVAELDDMAPVGVTNAEGELLVMRVTDTCSPKIPSAAVGPEEEFAATAREWVHRNTGLDVELDGPQAVWHLRVEDGDRTASRYFVVYAGTPAAESPAVPTADAPDPAVEAGWYETLPEETSEVPGTDLFV